MKLTEARLAVEQEVQMELQVTIENAINCCSFFQYLIFHEKKGFRVTLFETKLEIMVDKVCKYQYLYFKL